METTRFLLFSVPALTFHQLCGMFLFTCHAAAIDPKKIISVPVARDLSLPNFGYQRKKEACFVHTHD